jgi:hypothetical protein
VERQGTVQPRPASTRAARLVMFLTFLYCTPRYRTAISPCGWDLRGASKLSERGPRFSVAVRACAGGRFTFEIFTVSGEPRTLQVESRPYSSPGDAQRAGYEAIAAKDPQAQIKPFA